MTRKKTTEDLPRLFTSKSKPFVLLPDQRDRLARALSLDPVPDGVIDQIEDAIKHARSDSRLRVDAARAATREGRRAIARIERFGRKFVEALAVDREGVSEDVRAEVQH
jgi:hypothetical protein